MLTNAEIHAGETVNDDGRRVLVTMDLAEWNLLAHHRGWCHNTVACPTCQTALSHVKEPSGLRALRDGAASAVEEHPDDPILAIKALRAQFRGLGLLDARDYIEQIIGVRVGR